MKEPSTEQRLLLALVLSIVIITLFDLVIFRHQPQPPAAQKPAATATAPAATPAAAPKFSAMPQAASISPAPAKPAAAAKPVAATEQQTVTVENGLYRVVLSNRGAVVQHWQLLHYHDESTPPKILDVVHPPENLQSEEWPLSLLLVDPKLQTEANTALYQMTPGPATLRAPATVEFRWSDGNLSITKTLRFTSSYAVDLQTSVTLNGQPVEYAVAWRGGFGDATVYNASAFVQAFYAQNGKVETLGTKKLGADKHPEVPAQISGPLEFAGVEDQYFAAAFLPSGESSAWDWQTMRPAPGGKQGETEAIGEIAVGAAQPMAEPLSMRLFVGPKSLRVLGAINPNMRALVHYGILGFVAEPLFYVLRYIHNYVPNWGWAIVVMTIVLNMFLFPLKMSSWRSMQRMQKVMPEMKAIQARYKKYGMRDPRRQKMNEEMMELYKREGVNPMGSCLPMVIQMPIWFALYEMLEASIELRHAPWIFWIHDLSAHDPYYILPVLLMVSGYFMQKMTPMTMTDPNQQKMMNFMPVVFGLLFIHIQSGLLLYIFTSYLVGIAQQWYLNKTSPVAAAAKPAKA